MKTSTNSPYAQGELENANTGIVPLMAFKRSTSPTQADYTVTSSSATNIAIPDEAKAIHIYVSNGETIYVVAKDADNTGDCSSSNKDYVLDSTVPLREFGLAGLNRDANDFPTHVSMIASSTDATVHVRFF